MAELINASTSRKKSNHRRTNQVSTSSFRERIARQAVLSRLQRFEHGEIKLVEGNSERVFGQSTSKCSLSVTLTVRNPHFYQRVAIGGDIGAAESFMIGDWSCDSLTDLIRILIINSRSQSVQVSWFSWMIEPLYRIRHSLNRNSKSGSRKNIAEHYDLGNDFFSLFLDETRMYSCGLFERPESTLFEASTAKNERICQKLKLKPEDRLLEIGTGWGGFAIHAAKNYGCHVTTTTISEEQHAFASQRVLDAGLSDRITVLKQDYRDLRGQYDKLVSIEMIEAVGYEFYDQFFKTCSQLLNPNGLLVLQGITISDQLFRGYLRRVDFIQRYIFPGGCLPSVTHICDVLTRSTDMRLSHLEDFTSHYAQTLRHWRARFHEKIEEVRRLGFDERFIRMWNYYFCYCEGAFLERNCGLVQLILTKPSCQDTFLL